MIYTKETANAVLKQLNLPSAIIQIFEEGGGSIQSDLGFLYAPSYVYGSWNSIPYEDIVPIWEDGTVITAYDRIRSAFVRFSLEAPKEEWFCYPSIHQVTAELLIVMIENEELSEDELAVLAELFEFPYAQVLWDSYEASSHQSFKEHEQWKKDFMKTIG